MMLVGPLIEHNQAFDSAITEDLADVKAHIKDLAEEYLPIDDLVFLQFSKAAMEFEISDFLNPDAEMNPNIQIHG